MGKLTDWVNGGYSGRATKFVDFLNDFFLSMTQRVMDPTRLNRTLDLILTSKPNMIDEVTVQCPVAGSDHVLVWVLRGSIERKATAIPRYLWHKGDYDSIRCNLNDRDRSQILAGGDVQEKWNTFKAVMLVKRKHNELKENVMKVHRFRKNSKFFFL